MASSTTTPQEQASAFSELASKLQSQISQSSGPGNLSFHNDILSALDERLDQISLPKTGLTVQTRRQLDSRGTELWNLCTPLLGVCRDNESRVLGKVKTLAFAMLEWAAPSYGSGNIKALELAFKTARVCIENNHLDLSLKVLGTAAERLNALDTDETQRQLMTTEYYMLRIYLSWLQGRPDIAAHLFSKVPHATSDETRKIIIEICYLVGKSALSSDKYETAVVWLDKAFSLIKISSHADGESDRSMNNLKLLVLHSIARAYLYMNTEDSSDKLSDALKLLKADYGNAFSVFVIQLEVYSRGESPNVQEYFECIKMVIRAMDLKDANIGIAFNYIQKLSNWNLQLSVEALQLLLHELVLSDKSLWIENCLIVLIWSLTNESFSSATGFDILVDVVQRLNECGHGPLSENATNAVMILIWRIIDKALLNGHLSNAEQWSHFVIEESMFQNSSADNKSKFQRKLMACALENSNLPLASQTLNQMSEEAKTSPLTIYLAYKLALLTEDKQLSNACCDSLHSLGATGTTYLLSCAAESQRLGRSQEAINCLQMIISASVEGYHGDIHTPTLFQSMICLLMTELEKSKMKTELLIQLINVFETALEEANRQNATYSSRKSSNDELEWFSQHSYKLASHSLKSAPWDIVIKLLDISMKYADLQNVQPESTSTQYLSCNFLKSLKLISEAHHSTNPTIKEAHHRNLRTCIQQYKSHIQPLLNRPPTAEQKEWISKYRTLLGFDFEAAILLKEYNCLPVIIEEAKVILDESLISTYMDSILSSSAPVKTIMQVVKSIITTTHTSPSPTLSKPLFHKNLPRYLRILFTLSLPTDLHLSETVIDQVLVLARQRQSKTDHTQPYPKDELEWLATMTSNKAVDFYEAEKDGEFRRWAGKAIAVAEVGGGSGSQLGRLLRANFEKLVGDA